MVFYFTNFWKVKNCAMEVFVPFSVEFFRNSIDYNSGDEYVARFCFKFIIMNFEFSWAWHK